MVLSVFALRFTHADIFFFVFIAGFIFTLLYCMDLGQELRDGDGWASRVLGILLGVPQALLGLCCVALGVTMIGWVLYNMFIERDEHYTGGLMAFGFGPAMVLLGTFWIVGAFRRSFSPSGDDDVDPGIY